MEFKLHAPFKATGDQPQAIEKLARGVELGLDEQVLLGVTGSGRRQRSHRAARAARRWR